MICVSILSRNTEEAINKMAQAAPVADVLELRLDVMASFDLERVVRNAPRPVMITYRSQKEGGEGKADYTARMDYLCAAMELGADYVDVEYSLPLEIRERLFHMRRKSRIIISAHRKIGTPTREELEVLLQKQAATGADIIKIVTMAKHPADNLRVLGLTPMAQALGLEIIAFCMGPMGRISRIAAPLLGGYMTFSSLDGDQASAPGQLPAKEMRRILKLLGGDK